jgi:large subunit ribosomal protein L24
MYIKKNDKVIIIAGKDKGKEGKVLHIFREENRIIVEGVNVLKKHIKAKQQGKKGQVVEKAMPIDASNVALVNPKTKKPTRIGFEIKDGKKIRISKKSGEEI